MSRGLFVTFEGIDGSGKTTVLASVKHTLETVNINPFICKLPGDSAAGANIGSGIRQLLWVDPTTRQMAPGVADLLLLADTLQATERLIKPALADGHLVLCDRYVDSQRAYSAHPSKQSPTWAAKLFDSLITLEPDVTFLLVCDPEMAWNRSKARSGDEGAKQDGKVWGGVEAATFIQDSYMEQLSWRKRTTVIAVDKLAIADVTQLVCDRIEEALNAKT